MNLGDNKIDLFALLSAQADDNRVDTEIKDRTELRYALYLRKSTKGEDRQEHSIKDQKKDCINLVANRYKLSIRDEDIYEDKESAKVSGKRPAYNAMLKAVRSGKYAGIIAWHYDRLARNMKEAGEIIDLIDNGTIKDLLFATAHFENSPNGKMVLGINFVLSKHYSDHLSESVLRGIDNRTDNGSILNQIIHGYKIDEYRRLIADGRNWDILRQAFRMRIDEKRSQKQISDFMNDAGYKAYRISKGNYTYKMTNKIVSKLLATPLYAGIHKYGNRYVKLSEHYENFKPMISEQEYYELNSDSLVHSSYKQRMSREGRNDVSKFLRSFVICKHCNRTMSTGIVTRKDGDTVKNRNFRFKCETSDCPMRNKGPAGSLIRDYAVGFLKSNSFASEENYKAYLFEAKEHTMIESEYLRSQKKSLEIEKSKSQRAYENARINAGSRDKEMAKHYTSEYLDELKQKVEDYENKIQEISESLELMKDIPLSLNEFLELYKNTGEILRLTSSMTLADEIIRIFFSNITIEARSYGKTGKQKQWSITDHCLREPFDKLAEFSENTSWSG